MLKDNGGRILKAGGAVALAGLCATGVATGIACPILMGAAGTLAVSALRRKKGTGTPSGAPVNVPVETADSSGSSGKRFR